MLCHPHPFRVHILCHPHPVRVHTSVSSTLCYRLINHVIHSLLTPTSSHPHVTGSHMTSKSCYRFINVIRTLLRIHTSCYPHPVTGSYLMLSTPCYRFIYCNMVSTFLTLLYVIVISITGYARYPWIKVSPFPVCGHIIFAYMCQVCVWTPVSKL